VRGKIHRSGHIRELSHEFDRQFQTGIGITRVQGIYHQVFPLNENRVEALEVLKPRGNELQIVLQRTAGSRRLRVSGSDFNMRINSDLAHALASERRIYVRLSALGSSALNRSSELSENILQILKCKGRLAN